MLQPKHNDLKITVNVTVNKTPRFIVCSSQSICILKRSMQRHVKTVFRERERLSEQKENCAIFTDKNKMQHFMLLCLLALGGSFTISIFILLVLFDCTTFSVRNGIYSHIGKRNVNRFADFD